MNILVPFLTYPRRGFLIRELAKITKINHTTVRKFVKYYEKENLLVKKPGKPYALFSANLDSQKYRNLKLYYNLELLRTSNLITNLERHYDYPPIILFGSFAKGMDDEQSDVDLCIITNIQKEFNTALYEKIIQRPVSLHRFTKNNWARAIKKNKELVNNIINGITLSGQLEVI